MLRLRRERQNEVAEGWGDTMFAYPFFHVYFMPCLYDRIHTIRFHFTFSILRSIDPNTHIKWHVTVPVFFSLFGEAASEIQGIFFFVEKNIDHKINRLEDDCEGKE